VPGLPPLVLFPVIDLSSPEVALSVTLSELPALLAQVPDYRIRHVIESRKSRQSDLGKVLVSPATTAS
jgi:hypothetical protein